MSNSKYSPVSGFLRPPSLRTFVLIGTPYSFCETGIHVFSFLFMFFFLFFFSFPLKEERKAANGGCGLYRRGVGELNVKLSHVRDNYAQHRKV